MAKGANAMETTLSLVPYKKRLAEVFGAQAEAVKSTLIGLYNSNTELQKCEVRSIIGAAVFAETLHLSLAPSLGQAYIVPYNGKAALQISYKGLIQMALRTGQYLRLHAGPVREGEYAGINPMTGEPILGQRKSDKVVGYVAYLKLISGFEKTVYMTVEELKEHALKYSSSYKYQRNSSIWTKNFEAMATKTVLRMLLGKWGVLGVELAQGLRADQSVIDKETFTYVDNDNNQAVREDIYVPNYDEETGEIIEAEVIADTSQEKWER